MMTLEEWRTAPVPAGAVAIPLTQGFVTWVDIEDAEAVGRVKWCVAPSGHTAYARRYWQEGGRRRMVQLHRGLLEAPPGLEVDHINGDGLDNRRANLRLATHAENGRNRHVAWGQSTYRGVAWGDGSWMAKIRVDGHLCSLGHFVEEAEAARTYDAAARHYFGAFASLNFPDETPRPYDQRRPRRPHDVRECPYRGVRRVRNRWQASHRGAHLGMFAAPEQAARAYDAAARAAGRSARWLNFPQEGDEAP